MHDFDEKTGVIFFALVARNAITCWNSLTKYTPESHGIIIENDDRFKYPVDLNVSLVSTRFIQQVSKNHFFYQVESDGTLWALTNNFIRFANGKLDTNDYNYRLWRGNTKKLIKGTICEPRKFENVDKVQDGGPRQSGPH